MEEITIEYWNELAKQTLLVSSLLSGFSITIVTSLIVSEKNDKLTNRILKAATFASGCFLVSVFSMVDVVMATTPGGLVENVTINDFQMARTLGVAAFMIGLLTLCGILALSGWTKSKQVGRFTTVIGMLTLLLIILIMVKVSG